MSTVRLLATTAPTPGLIVDYVQELHLDIACKALRVLEEPAALRRRLLVTAIVLGNSIGLL